MEDLVYTIRVANTDVVARCSQNEVVAKALFAHENSPIINGCCGGGCGVCKMKIDSGSYIIVKKMSRAHVSEEDEKNNIVLLCCVKPCEDLIVSQV